MTADPTLVNVPEPNPAGLDTAVLPLGERSLRLILDYVMAVGDEAETTYLEVKSSLDLNSKTGVAKVAKFLLGAANRRPKEASPYFRGYAVMVIGASKDAAPGIPRGVEAHELEDRLRPYLGPQFPAFEFGRISVNDSSEVVFIIAQPPQDGDPIFPCHKSFQGDDRKDGLEDGAVYVRGTSNTRHARAGEILALVERSRGGGKSPFLSIEEVSERRRSGEDLLNDLGPAIGRESEKTKLSSALDRSADWPRVVFVNGIAGVGKTRLMVDCLVTFHAATPAVPVFWLSPGHGLDKDAIKLLPQTPAVIVIDDAHRGAPDLAILLNYAAANAGTQLVLGVRGLEARSIRNEVIMRGFRLEKICEITVGRLTLPEGRELVASLADGLSLDSSHFEALARQARDTPFVAVLMLNMIKGGQLSGPLSLDSDVREQVMARYGDILTGGIDAVGPEPLERVLATLSALGTVSADDEDVRSRILKLAGISLRDYLRLREQLRHRGIVIEQNGRARVIPELFADQVLERVASIEGVDTGFVEELWNALGDVAGEDLFTSVGSLQWRLAHYDGPHVMGPIWASVETSVDDGGYGDLYNLAGHLGYLPLTQPLKTLELLDRIRRRLDELEVLEPSQRPSVLRGDAGIATLFDDGEIGRTAVERRLAIPYGACAANGPERLETALDALWELGRRDSRPVDSALDHPLRIIIDRLCQVNRLPDPSYPERIIAKVRQWLGALEAGDASTPLAVLGPLLAKEGTTSEMQDPREISLGQFQVNPEWARAHRDAVRALCVKYAGDENLSLTSEIVGLLEGAVRPSRGYFGADVPEEQRNAWADDDLQTIAALRTIADITTISVIRRTVRRAVEIPAGYSSSPEVMHAALSLLHQLDQREDDDLSDHLLGGERLIDLDPQRGKDAPTLSECVERIAARSKQSAEGEAELNGRMKAQERRSHLRLLRLAESLWGPHADTKAGVDRLDAELREALLTSKSTPNHQLITLLQLTASGHADRVPDVVAAILDLSDGPLDAGLPILLDCLQTSKNALLDQIVAEAAAQREGVRWAIGRAAGFFGWANLGAPYTEAITEGVEDPSERVRQAFLTALPFVEDPITVSKTLIAGKATDHTIYDILRTPMSGSARDWYQNLNNAQATAVLDLLAAIQVGTWEAENRITDIATAHPRLVLDRMTGIHSLRHLLRSAGDHSLRAAFSGKPHEVAAWIIDGCGSDDPGQVASALTKVTGDRLPREVTGKLCAAVGNLSERQLTNLLGILASLNAWAAHHIELARRLTEHARTFGEHVYSSTLNRVSQHLTPHFWSGNDAGSPELQSALAAIERALESETNDELRRAEEEARQVLLDKINEPVPDYLDEF
ncbi:hypothetical protein [Arthrobacter sp. efr-133-TYG-118]|uniref:P-loop NTPase n=1 Tax=Arthrobacter sp. efr-133-TYG-118 TaxID=3040279 RepID=UPI0025503281|nr:hypothetical protein [Arthrobacter sp. efr-133-TYG-118]